MKILKFIIVLAIIAVVIVLAAKQSRKTGNVDDTIPPVATDTSEMCYLWNTEAGDSASLRLKFMAGTPNVSGSFNFIPAEKDKKTGSFTGTDDGAGNSTVWWNTSGEGMKVTEELRIKHSATEASVGFGEMKNRGDGVYVYAHPENLSYEPKLTQTECTDPALR